LASDVLFPALGHIVGAGSGNLVPAIVGLPAATEDQLKALGAAAAAAGAVAMFHAVGITPEAPDLVTAFHGHLPEATVEVTAAAVRDARDRLSTFSTGPVGAVCVGTPHASLAEMDRVVELLAGRRVAPGTEAYISTGRDIATAADASGTADLLAAAGFVVVTDTCTYVSPVLRGGGPVMTDSAKWAYYAPANIGVDVIFGSLSEVIDSAVAGVVCRDESLWSG
jgi:predicted aconitase